MLFYSITILILLFFTQDEKFSFETSVAVDQKSYGIQVAKNKDNEFYIAYIVPGSPAFKNTHIEIDDRIISIKTQDDTVPMTCKSSREINAFLSSPQHSSIQLEIRKHNAITKTVLLKKSLLAVEDNAVRAYILGDKNKAGYIRIPSFYTDLESPYGLGLANDVAKEIYKLKKEKVNGLILDLRNNGGGSMKEAIDLVGMFINRGPVTIVNQRNKDLITSKDFNRGAAYTDPLIILVNGNSASASELFASTMQDYQRGLIVGSRTYGKSTMQRIEPLSTQENLGFVKITSGGFYRVNGLTHQGAGVQPDITLPFLSDGIMFYESDQEFHLKLETVAPKLTFIKYPAIDIPSLKTKSGLRINSNPEFSNIKNHSNQLASIYDNYLKGYSIDFKSVFTFTETVNQMINNDSEDTQISLFKAYNTAFVDELLTYNQSDKEANKETLLEIGNDTYIYESLLILTDIINP